MQLQTVKLTIKTSCMIRNWVTWNVSKTFRSHSGSSFIESPVFLIV